MNHLLPHKYLIQYKPLASSIPGGNHKDFVTSQVCCNLLALASYMYIANHLSRHNTMLGLIATLVTLRQLYTMFRRYTVS